MFDLKKDFWMKVKDILNRNLQANMNASQQLLSDMHFMQQFEAVMQMMLRQYRQGGRVYIAGNGGSAADAQHLAAEFVSKLAQDRAPLPAEALTTDSSILTAIGNDYGYEKVFSRQLQAKATEKDIFLAITTSGKSPNIIEALKVCLEKGVPSVLLTGHQGGEAKMYADYCLIVPGQYTSTIQEMHIMVYHTLCEGLEKEIFFMNSEELTTEMV